MNIIWSKLAWADYQEWHSVNPRIAARINQLVEAIQRSPFTGIGKPEPLERKFAGWRSRRIDSEHRLVYRVTGKRGAGQRIEIVQCRYHY